MVSVIGTALVPRFMSLSDGESRDLLARHHVGRLAFSHRDRVDIQPVCYVFDDGWILGRTRVGAKLATLAHYPRCAFAVDAVRDEYDWDSVVVHGRFHMLDPKLGSTDRYDRAVELLRVRTPALFSGLDPTPDRSIVFGIVVADMTGRSARPS